MRNFFSTIILTIFFLSFTNAHEAEGEMPETSPNMLVLDDKSIDAAISANKKILIEFYAPWCGYCQAFAPKYENLADKVAADSSIDTIIAKIDGDANPDSMSKFQAEYFPTLILFSDGKPEQFNGDLEEDALLHFLETGENPAPSGEGEGGDQNYDQPELVPPFQIESAEDLEKNIGEASGERPLLVGFFSADLVNDYLEAFKESVFSGVSYAYVTDPKIASSKSDITFGSLVVFDASGTKDTLKFDDATKLPEKADMVKFLKANRFAEVGTVTMKNIEDYWRMEAEDNQATLYVVSPGGQEDKQLVALLTEAKKVVTKPMLIAMMKETDEIYTSMLAEMGLPKDSIMITVGANSQYNFNGDISNADEVKKFLGDYEAGTLKQFTKSQPIPETNDGPVFVVVADTFDDVIGKDNDVLLEAYAPWCGHCQELEPKYVKVGEAFKGIEGLVIAKYDADGNTPPAQVQGFPTLLFYPKGSTEPEEYSGNLEAKDIIEFVKSKTSADVSGVKHDEL